MSIRNLLCLFLAVCLMLSVAGCAVAPVAETQEVEETIVQDFTKEEPREIGEVHLRDKTLLYENQDPAEVVTMYLTVSTGNSTENTNHTWEEINTYSVYDYDAMGVDRYQVAGLLQVGDETGPLPGELGYGQLSSNCTVQIRGQTSSRNEQKNYKISIKDNKGSWNGQQTIALNKHMSDGLRFRNKLAYDLIAGIDEMMGLRTTFVHLYVKDTTSGKRNPKFEDYGLYTQVEQLNKTALKTHGLDKNGHLYKINFFEFYRYEDIIRMADDPAYDLKAFENRLEIKGDDDHSKLIRMLEAVNDYTVSGEELLNTYFDIENLSYWMAFHILTGNHDTQSRNVYIYSPLNSEKWYFYTWDNDGFMKKSEYALHGRTDGLGWEQGVSNYWGNVLFQRMLKTKVYREALDDAIQDLRSYLSADRISGMLDVYTSVVKPYVYQMPDKMYAPLTESEYDLIAEDLPNLIEQNYQDYVESYQRPMPFYIAPPEENDKEYIYRWDNAYDFDAENITYTFELASDLGFRNLIEKREDVVIPELTLEPLKPGQYFIRITATNSSGESQYAFDYYVTEDGKEYGIKCFYVLADGSIVEDVYEEG